MLNLNAITVRLGGRIILDRAAAALPPRSRVGLIGRNGAGKSTRMKVMIGQLDPDEGSCDMPRDTRRGYIAQEAPSGTATPFETVLEADKERAALMEELLEQGLNGIGIGPQGLTGNNSVMGVNIESSARHPSTIGVAVNTGCWAHRRGKIRINADLSYEILSHEGVVL